MNDLFVLNEWTENVFCATGPGGGIDPTCPKGGGKGLGANPKLSKIRPEVQAIQKILQEYEATGDIVGASITGSFARGEPDRKGEGTSDIDVAIHFADKSGASGTAYDIRDRIEKELKASGVTKRDVQGVVGYISESFSKDFITIYGQTHVRGKDRKDRFEVQE